MSDTPILGVDISKEKFDVTLLIEKEPHKTFSNDEEGFEKLTAWLRKQGVDKVWACMEYTNKFWTKLAVYLWQGGNQVSMISPAVASSYASGQRRAKGDAIDSKLNATYCRDWNPRLWEPPSEEERRLKEVSHARAFLKKQLGALRNHMSTLEFVDAATALRAQEATLEKEIAALEQAQIELIAHSAELQAEYSRWDEIKGVGPETATTVIVELGSLKKFERYITVRRLAGLDTVRNQSGKTLLGKEKCSKKGNVRVRAVLHMAALSAIKSNPRFREFAKRLKSRGKHGSVIVNAVANKLLLTMWALSRNSTHFEPDHKPDWLLQPATSYG